jgi:leucyl aminopeptidase (aminopeptidase T)
MKLRPVRSLMDMRYFEWELQYAANKVINYVTGTKEGENVVITADTVASKDVVAAVANAAYAASAVPTVIWYPTAREIMVEPPKPVATALLAADVWIQCQKMYLLNTQAFKRSLEAGARFFSLSNAYPDSIVRMIGRVDYPKMLEFGEKLVQLTNKANRIQITTPAGTDIVAEMMGRKAKQTGGLARNPGDVVFLGGQVAWCPVEETINGTVVFDGAVWPPEELMDLKTPVELKVEKGVIRDIKGEKDAEIFKNWLASFNDSSMYRIAHYTYGFNPGARFSKQIGENERVYGIHEFGVGMQLKTIGGKGWDAAAHTDGVMLNPTILLDDEVIEKDGKFVHPELKKIEKAFKK